MSLGSTKPWREVVGKILPKGTGLSSLALLEYYQPIVNWIETHNKQTKAKIGWNSTEKSKLGLFKYIQLIIKI